MTDSPYMVGNVALVRVKRAADAIVLHCDSCGKVADTLPCNPFWGLDKSAWMHKQNGRCDPKGVRFYGFPKEAA